MDALVSAAWLNAHLADPDLRILDATALMPGDPRDLVAEFAEAHIPGARFLALASLADPDDARPMMLPDAALVAERLSALGVSKDSRIILYDSSSMCSSARAWWMLHRVYGFRHVALLDGGWKAWQAGGYPVEAGPPKVAPTELALALDRSGVRTMADMLANIASKAEQVADARGFARFAGSEPEPRPGMAAGHIPGSVNLPYSSFFAENGLWKDAAGLKQAFADAGLDLARPLATTCGSGVTACVIAFAAHLLGKADVAVYDGSWSEWGMDPEVPKAVS